MGNKFNVTDKEKFIQFLNHIHKTAIWKEVSSQDQLEYAKLLTHMQTQILPKIEANILEVLEVKEDKKSENEE